MDLKNIIYTYLEFYELNNIKVVHRYFSSPSLIKDRIGMFIKEHNILEKENSNYYIQIYYQRTRNIWDYMNICSCNKIYNHVKGNNKLLKMRADEYLVIYYKYRKECYIQSKKNLYYRQII